MTTIAPNTYRQERSIGGSDVAAVMGKSRYKTAAQVYDAITGAHGVRPVDGDRGPTERGRALESWIVALYERETGFVTRQQERCWAEECDYMHASPDRLISTSYGDGLLEIKAPGTYVLSQWKQEGIPEEYYLQMQHYMAVLNLEWADFCAFDYNAFDVWIVRVERDPVTIAALVAACDFFWTEYVQKGTRPPEDLKLMPDELKWPKGRPGAPVTRKDAEWLAAEHALARAATDYKLAETSLDLAKERIKTLMGEEQEISGAELRVTWKETTSRSLDIKALLKDKGIAEDETTPYVRVKATRRFNLYPVKEAK